LRNFDGRIGFTPGDGLTNAFELVENAARVHHKTLAGVCQQHAPTITAQQLQAKFSFECADLPTYRGLS
jgi:hypothetical protein